jgi:hypothetical protein
MCQTARHIPVHSCHCEKVKSDAHESVCVSDKGVMLHTATVCTEDECKIRCSNFNWFDCDGDFSCLLAVLTSQKGAGSCHKFVTLQFLWFI